MEKSRILSLVMALVLTFSLAALPAVVGAAINVPPVAQAGPDQAVHQEYAYDGNNVVLGDFPEVTLDGSASYDQNGDNLTYEWTFVSVPEESSFYDLLLDPVGDPVLGTTAVVKFTPDVPGEYVLELVVTDDGVPPYDNTDAGQEETVTVIAGNTWFVCLCGQDGWDGTAFTHLPSTLVGPFRTITHAIEMAEDGDRILVGPTGPSTHYGGSDPNIAENIDIDKWLTVQSLAGATSTVIDVSAQMGMSQVVEITANPLALGYQWGPMGGVVLGCDGHGFTVRGACTGIYAEYSDYVYIHQNVVDLDECCLSETGIEAYDCKMPVVHDNKVVIKCTERGTGIVLADCETGPSSGAEATENRVIVEAGDIAEAIVLIACPKSYVACNEVDVKAGPASMAVGIALYDGCYLAVVENNDLLDCDAEGEDTWGEWGVFAEGDCCSAAFGIEVEDSRGVTVYDNDMDVTATSVSGYLGGLLAIGIHMADCANSDVDDNYVNVVGSGNAQVYAGPDDSRPGIGALDAAELDSLQQVVDEVIGEQVALALAGGLVLGIVAANCPYIDVTNNVVAADVEICLTAGDMIAIGAGAALAFGITVLGSVAPDVVMNEVTADAFVDATVTATDYIAVGTGKGLAVGMGIVVAFCPPDPIHKLTATVEKNSVEASGAVEALVEALTGVRNQAEEDSVIAKIDSDVLQVVYDVITDTSQSEEVDVMVQGEPEALLLAIADGAALGIGIGIATLMSDEARVFDNDPVVGTGCVDVQVLAVEWELGVVAMSAGAGIGLGIGILSLMCIDTQIFDNLGVDGTGWAVVDAEAAEIVGIVNPFAHADSFAAGIGLGILAIGRVTPAEAEAADGDQLAPSTAFVAGNEVVLAKGKGTVTAQAFDRDPDGDAFAFGDALGAGMGIVVIWHWCPVIALNVVDAVGEGCVDVYATAISTVDPYALGVGTGIALGIMAGGSPGAEITGNIVDANGSACGEVSSVEFMIMPAEIAEAAGTSIGVGIGMLVAGSPWTRISENTSTGVGDAGVYVSAKQLEPLEEAWAWALGLGMGEGIVITLQCCACVKESNVFEAGANVVVSGEAIGDFAHACELGAAVAIDAVVLLVPHGVAFNYNDMPGAVKSSLVIGGVPQLTVIDWGMLALASNVDARYNWWGRPCGPSGMGLGRGQAIYWCPLCTGFEYEPWLRDVHAPMLETHIGKFGFSVCFEECWNTFSTPIALDATVDTWDELVAWAPGLIPGVTVGPAFEWNGTAWAPATDLTPLKGIYVYVFEPTCAVLKASDQDSLPTRNLSQGWNLIGPNPPFCDDGIEVYAALRSIEQTPSGLPGYTQIVSPPVSGQDSWYWVPGMSDAGDTPWMESGRAYWVWMENPDTLVGFGFTPIELYPCGEWHCPSPCYPGLPCQ